MSGLSTIAQLALTSGNLQRSIAFYRDTLGLKLMFEVSGMAFFDVGGIRLMLGETKLDAPIQPNSYVYFDAGDWFTTEANLEARGVKFDRPADVVQRAEGKEHAIRFFRDPDGNALAIMGWRPAA